MTDPNDPGKAEWEKLMATPEEQLPPMPPEQPIPEPQTAGAGPEFAGGKDASAGPKTDLPYGVQVDEIRNITPPELLGQLLDELRQVHDLLRRVLEPTE